MKIARVQCTPSLPAERSPTHVHLVFLALGIHCRCPPPRFTYLGVNQHLQHLFGLQVAPASIRRNRGRFHDSTFHESSQPKTSGSTTRCSEPSSASKWTQSSRATTAVESAPRRSSAPLFLCNRFQADSRAQYRLDSYHCYRHSFGSNLVESVIQ